MGRKPKTEEPVFNRLEEARLAAGLTRAELAAAVGIHYQTLGYLERGEYSPSLVLALRISSVLQTPIEQIFSLEDFAPKPVKNGIRK